MKKVISCCMVLSFVLGISSCRHELSSTAYIQYVQDTKNGLKKVINISGWEYSIQYKPYDYIILMENKGDRNAFDISKRNGNLTGTAWFNISFRVAGAVVSPMRYALSSKDEYDRRLNYFLNEAINSIRLIYDNKDTLTPTGYLFENNYNLTPQETMVVGFSLPAGTERPGKDMQISYNDKVFKNGIIKVKYKRGDLNSIPKLIY